MNIEHGMSKAYSDLWAEFAPNNHFVQIYNEEDAFLDTLEGFVSGGLLSGDGVITIATGDHSRRLDQRLLCHGIDPNEERELGNYITLDAQETLDKFILEGMPDKAKFQETIGEVLKEARRHNPRIRAFGEMVAILWAEGKDAATIQLESLWHDLCHEKDFSLFCAYPKKVFAESADYAVQNICDTHSRVIN